MNVAELVFIDVACVLLPAEDTLCTQLVVDT